MILKADLKPRAKKRIDSLLKDYPGVLKVITHTTEWDDFVDRLHVRANELELQGLIKTKAHLDEIVNAAVCTFGLNVLEKYAAAPARERASFQELGYRDFTQNRKV